MSPYYYSVTNFYHEDPLPTYITAQITILNVTHLIVKVELFCEELFHHFSEVDDPLVLKVVDFSCNKKITQDMTRTKQQHILRCMGTPFRPLNVPMLLHTYMYMPCMCHMLYIRTYTCPACMCYGTTASKCVHDHTLFQECHVT